jgi:hypothetical protein
MDGRRRTGSGAVGVTQVAQRSRILAVGDLVTLVFSNRRARAGTGPVRRFAAGDDARLSSNAQAFAFCGASRDTDCGPSGARVSSAIVLTGDETLTLPPA